MAPETDYLIDMDAAITDGNLIDMPAITNGDLIDMPAPAVAPAHDKIVLIILGGVIAIIILVAGFVLEYNADNDYPEFTRKVYLYTYGALIFNYALLVVLAFYALMFEENTRPLTVRATRVHVGLSYLVRALFGVAIGLSVIYGNALYSIPFALGAEAFLVMPVNRILYA